MIKKSLYVLIGLFLLASIVNATTHYVREDGGSYGAENGTDWTNAYDGLPETLTRGDTYVIAGGDYGSYAFNDALSGTSLITVRKANATQDSGVSGWSAAYGTDQAVFTGQSDVWNFTQGYYLIDGITGGGSGTGSEYGIKVTYASSSTTINPMVEASNNMTISNVWFLGFAESGMANVGVHGISDYVHAGFKLSYSLVEKFTYGVDTAGVGESIYEYNYFKGGYGPNCCHQDYIRLSYGWETQNKIFRYNVFEDVLEAGYTGLFVCVGTYSTYPAAFCDDIKIYGNIFVDNLGGGNGSFTTSDSGSSSALPCNDWLIYNNTFVGGATVIHFYYNYSGHLFKNNLLYDSNGYLGGATADYNYFNSSTAIGTNQVVSTESILVLFVNYGIGNYTTGQNSEAIDEGIDLGSPYNVDLNGTIRGVDEAWDIGAYEYGAGAVPGVISIPGKLSISSGKLDIH